MKKSIPDRDDAANFSGRPQFLRGLDPITENLTPQSGSLEYPDTYGNYNDDIENRLDASGHWNITVNQPERHTGNDQNKNDVN
jgi:hypothetical protein